MTPATPPYFTNIADIPAYGGRQVKFSPPAGPTYQLFIKGLTDDALRRCLRQRNALYRLHDALANRILLAVLTRNPHSPTSNTGLQGIYQGMARERTGSEFPILGINVRNLRTARPTNRTLRIHHFGTAAGALRAAQRLRQANITAYNRIATEYNRLILADGLKLAAAELEQLRPMLYRLIGFDAERWTRARDLVYPRGFLSSIEPA